MIYSQDFKLECNGVIVAENIKGFFCKNDDIQIKKGTYTPQSNDVIIHEETNQRFRIGRINPLPNFYLLHCPISEPVPPVQNINIGTIAGNAVVGSQQTATINAGMTFDEISAVIANMKGISDDDRKQLQELAATVESLKSTGILERMGPILGSILQPVTAWLLPK